MIKKYKEFIKESLLDKLEGPSIEEVETNLKDRLNPDSNYDTGFDYDNGIMNNGHQLKNYDYIEYIKKLKEFGFKLPPKSEIEEKLKERIESGKLNRYYYYVLSKEYDLTTPSKEFLWGDLGCDSENEIWDRSGLYEKFNTPEELMKYIIGIIDKNKPEYYLIGKNNKKIAYSKTSNKYSSLELDKSVENILKYVFLMTPLEINYLTNHIQDNSIYNMIFFNYLNN